MTGTIRSTKRFFPSSASAIFATATLPAICIGIDATLSLALAPIAVMSLDTDALVASSVFHRARFPRCLVDSSSLSLFALDVVVVVVVGDGDVVAVGNGDVFA